jgi:hypothetical protein
VGRTGPKTRKVNEDLLVKRYTVARWPVARCAREQEISAGRARAILAEHGVPLRGRPELDPAVVVAAYEKHRSVTFLEKAWGASRSEIEAILDDHGIERLAHGPTPVLSSSKRSRR